MKTFAAQLNFTIGDLAGNFAKIKQTIEAQKDRVDLIVFSELAITGYPPNDLLLRKGFVDKQLSYLEQIRYMTADIRATVLIGVVTKNDGIGKPLRNTVVALRNGEVVFQYYKQLLPTYNIFDENRYFEAGANNQTQVFDVFDWETNKNCKVGVLICEDAWNDEAVTDVQLYSTNPFKELMNQNPEFIVTVNASPSHTGKNLERYKMYSTLAKRYKRSILYVNQVGGNDALIFDGFSFYAYYDPYMDDSITIVRAKGYVEDTMTFETIGSPKDVPINQPLVTNPDEIMFRHLVLGIQDYVTKNGFKKVVVGSSGGIDSAVTIALAVEALGAENVIAITMPSKVSSAGSVDDSVELCKMLGVKLFNRSILEEVDLSIANFTKAFGEPPSRLTIENEQARIRGRILMEYSNHFGALVLSTGNKSEMSVGYCTIYGDMCGGLAVIADAYKMEVFSLAKWYNEYKGNIAYMQRQGQKFFIPENIINKEPSAELWDNQKDTDSLPPYPILDAILHLYLERDLLTEKEIQLYGKLCETLTVQEIKRILQMTDRAEFKRQQAPPVLRVHRRAFGFGRNLPITQKFEVSYENVL